MTQSLTKPETDLPKVQTKSKFVYDDVKHTYYFDGERMTGCTTCLSTIAKPNLMMWYAKEAVEKVWNEREKLNAMSGDELKVFLIEAAGSANSKKDNAADIGKEAHKWCELYDKGLKPAPDPKLKGLVENYIAWREENVEQVLMVEKPLFSLRYFVAGTPDRGYLMKNGQRLIGDTKFTGGIYDRTYFAQMAGYRMMIEEMSHMENIEVEIRWKDKTEHYDSVQEYLGSLGGMKWDGGVVMRQGKPLEDQSDKLFPKRPMDHTKDFEVAYSYAFEDDIAIFLSAYTLYKKNNYK